MKYPIAWLMMISSVLAGQPTIGPNGSAQMIKDIKLSPSTSAVAVAYGFVGDSSNRAQQIWPATPLVTVSAPSYSGGGAVNSGATGSITLHGSTSSDGAAVTYDVVSHSNVISLSATTGIADNGVISFRVATLSSPETWSISVRAKNTSGVHSSITSISGSVYIPQETTIYDGIPPSYNSNEYHAERVYDEVTIPVAGKVAITVSGVDTSPPDSSTGSNWTQSGDKYTSIDVFSPGYKILIGGSYGGIPSSTTSISIYSFYDPDNIPSSPLLFHIVFRRDTRDSTVKISVIP